MDEPVGPGDPFPPSQLDRLGAVRGDEAALQRLWEHPDARFVAVRDGAIALPEEVADVDAAGSIGRLPPGLVRSSAARRVLLGVDPQRRPWWLLLPQSQATMAPGPGERVRWAGLRSIGPHTSALQTEVLMAAVAVASWHARHGFCPGCGHPTEPVAGGWVRRCTADGTEHYPRTDPAVIVVVIDEQDRALLGRQARWPQPWRSALAGFVEPGESAESAVRREVSEEVGLRLDRVRYVGSQPWPFPGSLMLGFHAWTGDTAIEVDGEEIAEAQWFTREQLAEEAAAGRIQLPPSISIARSLIERWFGQPLAGSWLRT